MAENIRAAAETKTVLVTGGATGIGRAIVERLADDGASVLALGLDGAEGAELEFSQRTAGRPVRFIEADVTNDREMRAAVALAEAEFGALNAIVNNAGVCDVGQRLEDLSDADWQAVIDVNLTGVFRVCRAGLPALRRAGGGGIVNIASVHALASAPGYAAYAASKGAVLSLSKQIALDYASDGIRVNSLLVGSVNTRMSRPVFERPGGVEALGLSFARKSLPRIGEADEIANIVAFLLSEGASFINGSGLIADGGLLARIL